MKIQNRNETRADVNINVEINELIINKKLISLPKKLHMKIVNLSCGGALLFSNIELNVGTFFCGFFKINKITINVMFESLRKEIKNNKIYYGCQFVGLSKNEIKIIRAFVFQEQANK